MICKIKLIEMDVHPVFTFHYVGCNTATSGLGALNSEQFSAFPPNDSDRADFPVAVALRFSILDNSGQKGH